MLLTFFLFIDPPCHQAFFFLSFHTLLIFCSLLLSLLSSHQAFLCSLSTHFSNLTPLPLSVTLKLVPNELRQGVCMDSRLYLFYSVLCEVEANDCVIRDNVNVR